MFSAPGRRPITAIMGKLSSLADSAGHDFYLLLAATGVWVSLLMFVIAGFRLSTLAQRFTPFTLDIFACFVCSIYVFDGVTDVWRRLETQSMDEVGRSLLDLNLALVTFFVSVRLQGATRWSFLYPRTRELLSDYAVTIAVVSSTLCSYSISIAKDIVLRIELPATPGPSCELDAIAADTTLVAHPDDIGESCLRPMPGRTHLSGALIAPQTPRPWLVNFGALFSAGPSLWLTALVAAVPIAFFFFFDQNISTLFCQRAAGGLGRGRYQHSAFVALGILNLLGPLIGCPFLTGSLPHSPQFVRALTVPSVRSSSGVEVAESRFAPLLVYLFIGLPLLAPRLILAIPGATIDGVLMFVGYEGIVGTSLFERTLMIITPKYEFTSRFKGLRKRRISMFTGLQLLLFALCWMINLSPLGLAVAFLICSLVPMRERLLPKIFTAEELEILDGDLGCGGGSTRVPAASEAASEDIAAHAIAAMELAHEPEDGVQAAGGLAVEERTAEEPKAAATLAEKNLPAGAEFD